MSLMLETARTIQRFMLVGESLPDNAKKYQLFFLTGVSPALYACFTDGTWTQLFSSLASGAVILGGNSAPADGDIANGTAVLYFDPTNGASFLGIKAKELDGTVVNAQVFTT